MSGLYNVVFPERKNERVALAVKLILTVGVNYPDPTKWDHDLGKEPLTHLEFGRYRDLWLERHGDQVLVRVHTRNGGDNRADYQWILDDLADHPWWVRDEDLAYDPTYADIYFLLPPSVLERFPQLMEAIVEPVDMGQLWDEAIRSIRTS